jgi:hypothetical protein
MRMKTEIGEFALQVRTDCNVIIACIHPTYV